MVTRVYMGMYVDVYLQNVNVVTHVHVEGVGKGIYTHIYVRVFILT